MDWYSKIDKFYNNNLWTLQQVKDAVVKNKITESEYKKITGEDYTV